MDLEILDPNSYPEWNEFVDDCSRGTLFHQTTWMEPLDPVVRVVRDTNGICAGLLSVPGKRLGIKGYHLPPYTSIHGPLVRDSAKGRISSARSEERKWLGDLLDGLGPQAHLDFMIPTQELDLPAYVQRGYQIGYWMSHEVEGSYQDWQAGIASTQRSKLKKLQKEVDQGQLNIRLQGGCEDVLALATETSARKGYNMNLPTLQALLRPELEGSYWTVVRVMQEDDLLCGAIMLHDKKRAWYVINGVRRDLQDIHRWTNLLVLSASIEWSLTTGRVFDFEGSLLPGVEDFYRMMGGAPRMLARIQKSGSFIYRALRYIHVFNIEGKFKTI